MRKTGIFILLLQCFCLCIHAQTDSAKPEITIQESNVPIQKILNEITLQSELEFSYSSQLFDTEKLISFSIKKASLENTLNLLGEKLNLEYAIVENQIVLNHRTISEEEIEYFTISGFVSDDASGESLIGASVIVPGTSQGVFTNAFGYYSIQVKKGNHIVHYSYVGYEVKKINLELTSHVKQDMSMVHASIDLPSIIVDQKSKNIQDKKQLGELALSPDDLNNMPEFGGESGLVKGLQSLPGIKTHSDGSAFFYVRGGERDQNLIIIDDAPIYNPSHLFGFYSTVIPDFTKSIKVYKSDIPTNLGDRVSSIVSIRTKDGNLNRFQFSGAVNPLIYRFSIETPIVKKKGSIFTSFRRSNFEWMYKKNAPDVDLFFSDFNFKWNYKFNDKNRVFFTTIITRDNFTNQPFGREASGVRWANLAATLRWNHLFGPRLFSNTTIYTGNYAYQLLFAPNYWKSGLSTLSLKSDFTHYVNPVFTAKFGVEFQGYSINPGSLSIDTTIAIIPTLTQNSSRKNILYYQGAYDISEKTQLNVGLRLISWLNYGPTTYYDFDEVYQVEDTVNVAGGVYKSFLNLDPRISIKHKLSANSQMKLSYGIYHQYLQLISNSESPFTSLEVWLPASPNIKPQLVQQVALNYLRYFEKPKLEFSTALYYKKFDRQIDYEDHALTLLNPLVEGELRFGTIRAYGLELLLKKASGRLNGWVGYTYSRSIKKTEGVNEGRRYPAFQDRPHDFSLNLNYRISKRVFGSAYYTFYTGSPFSSPTGFYTFNEQTIPVFGEKNNDRLPDYRRLDLAFKFILKTKEKSRYEHSLTFSIYNFLARRNVISVNFNKIPSDGSRPVVKANFLSDEALIASQIDLIRFFPSLTYKFKL